MSTKKHPTPETDAAIAKLREAVQDDIDAAVLKAQQEATEATQAKATQAIDDDDPEAARQALAATEKLEELTERVKNAKTDDERQELIEALHRVIADLKAKPATPSVDDNTAPRWFASYTEHFGATGEDGKPTKAAAKSDLDGLAKRVKKLEAIAHFGGGTVSTGLVLSAMLIALVVVWVIVSVITNSGILGFLVGAAAGALAGLAAAFISRNKK